MNTIERSAVLIVYPSKDFSREASEATENHHDFIVKIPKESNKKELILSELPRKLGIDRSRRPAWQIFRDQFKLWSFYHELSAPLLGVGYKFEIYEEKGDLYLKFTAVDDKKD